MPRDQVGGAMYDGFGVYFFFGRCFRNVCFHNGFKWFAVISFLAGRWNTPRNVCFSNGFERFPGNHSVALFLFWHALREGQECNVSQWFLQVPLADPHFHRMDRHSAAVWWKAGNVDFLQDFARFGPPLSFLHSALSGQTAKSSRFPMVFERFCWSTWSHAKSVERVPATQGLCMLYGFKTGNHQLFGGCSRNG